MYENEKWINIPEQGKGKNPVPYQKISFDMHDDWKEVTFDHMLAVAPNGGPVAITRSATKLYATSGNHGQYVMIYSGLGQKISKFRWFNHQTLIYMGWTDEELLLCLTRQGKIFFFSMYGEKQSKYHDCGLDVDEEVLSAKMKKNSLVIFTKRVKRKLEMAEQRKSKRILSFGSKKNQDAGSEDGEHSTQHEHCIRVIEGVSFEKCTKSSFGIIENLPPIDNPEEVVIEFFYKEVLSDNLFDSATDEDMDESDVEENTEGNVQSIAGMNMLSFQANTHYKIRNKLENLKIYLAIPNIPGIYIATQQRVDFREIGVVKLLRLSPQQKYLAVYVEGFGLIVFDTDVKKSQDKFTTSLQTVPSQLAWCKNSMICMYIPIKQESKAQRHILLFVRTKDDIKPQNYSNPLFIEQDCDGVRIFMQHYKRTGVAQAKLILWQKVPPEMITLYTTNTEAGKKLYQFYKDYTQKRQSNINEMRAIQSEMPRAVTTCLKVAVMSFDVRLQQDALRAAAYGKNFISEDTLYFKHSDFDYYCRIIRVLNALRQPNVGIILSYHQFLKEGKEKIIQRLTHRNMHYLSFKLCDYWGMHMLRALVLHHWACTKIAEEPTTSTAGLAQSITNSEVVDTTMTESEHALVAVLKDQRDRGQIIYFADIAEHALNHHKLSLALNLCMLESNTEKQVPLLQRLGKHNLALDKAIDSFNTDVIYQVVLDLKNTSIDRVHHILKSDAEYKLARKLLISYCRQNDLDSLKQFYNVYDDQQYNLGMAHVHEYFTTNNSERQEKALSNAQSVFSIAGTALESTAVQQQKTLLERQRFIDEKFKPEDEMHLDNESFIGLSLNETIIRCIERGDAKLMDFANKLRKEFKVPDKRYWYLKISALARGEKWDLLQTFAKSKSPVGHVPFAKIAIAFDQIDHARQYVKMVNDPMDKIELYMQLSEVDAAISICKSRKSVDLFKFALGLAPTFEGRRKITTAFNEMNL